MMQQGISGAPRWFKKTAEEGKSEEGHTRYYDRVSKLVADQKARLLYRPHDLSPLGAIGVDGGEDMVELKWFINKAPTQWITADDVIAWITKRGFNKVSEVARIGSRVWTFIGEAPAGVHTTAFEFSSGILVTRGVKNKAKKTLQAEAKVAKSRWGAPKATAQLDEPMPQEQPSQSSSPQPGNQAEADKQAAQAAGREKPSGDQPPAHRQKGADGKPVANPHGPPFNKFFNIIPNEGGGDCFFIAAAQGAQLLSPSKRKTEPSDFAPGGRLQGGMRMLLEQAVRRGAFKASMETAGKWVTSGVPAEALAVRLVADQLKADIYIWVKSKDNGTWALYGREAKAKKRTKEIFMKLEDQHYEWLQPKPDLGGAAQDDFEKLLEDWRAKAWPYPGVGLKGKGERSDMDCPPSPASRRSYYDLKVKQEAASHSTAKQKQKSL